MAKRPSKEYVASQEVFLRGIESESDTLAIGKGVLYKVIKSGESDIHPQLNSVVSVHYRGTLSSGKEFDSTLGNGYPETFRLREVITGWQIALLRMSVGDKWVVYIPAEVGYGDRTIDNIPGGSALIFEIELLSIN